jgi:phosphoribosylaminoimidazole-succinocarboxamide synthase
VFKGLKICLNEKISVFDKNKNKSAFKGTKNLKIAKMWFPQKLKN